jgi:hypothetical protein
MSEKFQEELIDAILDEHVGEDYAISWRALLNTMIGNGYDINKNDLRGIIRIMRRKESLICSSQNGYWRPATLKEVMDFTKRLRTPAVDQFVTARIQRQAAQRYFGGQMPIEGK